MPEASKNSKGKGAKVCLTDKVLGGNFHEKRLRANPDRHVRVWHVKVICDPSRDTPREAKWDFGHDRSRGLAAGGCQSNYSLQFARRNLGAALLKGMLVQIPGPVPVACKISVVEASRSVEIDEHMLLFPCRRFPRFWALFKFSVPSQGSETVSSESPGHGSDGRICRSECNEGPEATSRLWLNAEFLRQTIPSWKHDCWRASRMVAAQSVAVWRWLPSSAKEWLAEFFFGIFR